MSVFSASPIVAAFARGVQQDEIIEAEVAEEDVMQEEEEQYRDAEGVRKRKLQQVSTQQTRVKIVKWMTTDEAVNGKKGLFARTVRKFPGDFRGSFNANSTKASRWWDGRENIALANNRQSMLSVNHPQPGKLKKMMTKAAPGRGRKREEWVSWLYSELVSEFNRYRKAGVKFTPKLLLQLGLDVIKESSHPVFMATYVSNGKDIVSRIDYRWIQRFMEANNIVGRAQTGKLMVSKERMTHIEKEIAYHLGVVAREFQSGVLDENLVENVDETHFVVNMDNGKTLGFRGDNDVKYADVVSGGIGMTMVVRLTGGPGSTICSPFMIFQNANESYPIRGVPDNVPGVSYRSAAKGFMTKKVWLEWLAEPRAQRRNAPGITMSGKRIIFVDNYGGHNDSPEVQVHLERARASIRKLVACATDKVQPCDSFVISKIKDAWTSIWEDYKFKAIKEGSWADVSGAIRNPGKTFFLELAAEAVKRVNAMRDANGMSYARKAMIRCGLSLDVTNEWHVKQLSPELQNIVAKHRNHFDGEAVQPL